jgi:hypothetical protein
MRFEWMGVFGNRIKPRGLSTFQLHASDGKVYQDRRVGFIPKAN